MHSQLAFVKVLLEKYTYRKIHKMHRWFQYGEGNDLTPTLIRGMNNNSVDIVIFNFNLVLNIIFL